MWSWRGSDVQCPRLGANLFGALVLVAAVAMVLISVLPVGLLQTQASVSHGYWYARSAEFLQSPVLERLRWMRMLGDTVFLSGVAALAWFVAGLWTGRSLAQPVAPQPPAPRRLREPEPELVLEEVA